MYLGKKFMGKVFDGILEPFYIDAAKSLLRLTLG